MQFNKSLLDFEIRPSPCLGCLSVFTHITALVAIAFCGFKGVWPLAAVVVAGGAYHVSRYVLLRHPLSVVAVRYRAPHWRLQLFNGEEVAVELRGQVLVASYLLVMNFVEPRGRGFSVPLFPDAVTAVQHRFGRVFFRMAG
jgi:hypothetical protein|tara:strand:- start:709 stop:1131 length:423 start_codon:yes stop_codon:yes gene_type:complete